MCKPVAPPPPPEGMKVIEVTSEYYGSHPERGFDDEHMILAVPEGTKDPVLTHGSFANNWEEELPPETLEWLHGEWSLLFSEF